MVLTVLLAWPSLAMLSALFMYCCATVSDGAHGAPQDDDATPQDPFLTTAPVRSV